MGTTTRATATATKAKPQKPRAGRLGLDANQEKLLVTVPQAAAALAIGERLAWRLVGRGDLRSILVAPRARRVPIEAIKEFIAGRMSA